MTHLLQVSDAKVHFGGVRAVDGVSLVLSQGRVHGMVGPNGSGKTTLLNAMSGVQRLTSGRLLLAERDVTGVAAHRFCQAGVARTFQTIKLLPTLTVRENVQLGVDHVGRSSVRRADRLRTEEATDKALERLAITGSARRLPGELSYGARRRVEIARALASEPQLLMLDEPLAGMNRAEREDISMTIRRLGDEGVTQLIVEHDLRTLLSICDHLFVMNLGRLMAEGPPRETAADPDVQDVYLGRRHGAA